MPPAGAKTKRIFMLNWFGKHVCPIGVDLGNGFLRMAQIGFNGSGPYLHAAGIVAFWDGGEPVTFTVDLGRSRGVAQPDENGREAEADDAEEKHEVRFPSSGLRQISTLNGSECSSRLGSS